MKKLMPLGIIIILCNLTTPLFSQDVEPGPRIKAESVPSEVLESRDFLVELEKNIGPAKHQGRPEGFITQIYQQNLKPGVTRYILSFKSIYMPPRGSIETEFSVIYDTNEFGSSRVRLSTAEIIKSVLTK